jgi:UDP-N-acetyl-2-amino-2-deoxyglucuronate dehydrogenase
MRSSDFELGERALAGFALIGAAGYIAPRHMAAIKSVGGVLLAAIDPKDSVGMIDSYFPDAHFFTEFERFDRHIDKLRRRSEGVGYIAICSPNYLHDAHCRFALRSGADAICEKPLVLNPWNLDGLAQMEKDTGRRIATILQLRLHPAIRKLKERVAASNKRHSVDLTYIASRGRWYHASWKGDEQKSGGVATNIGIHFFDMLSYVFGAKCSALVHVREADRAAGFISYQHADVRWFLSIDRNDLPAEIREKKPSYRSLTIDGEEIDFSDGFTDLHSDSYREILGGRGFSLDDVRPCVEAAAELRSATLVSIGEYHPMARKKKISPAGRSGGVLIEA